MTSPDPRGQTVTYAIPNDSELIAAPGPGAHGGETPPPREADAIAQIAMMIEQRVAGAVAANHGRARRDAHPKSHGCVRAVFRVLDDLPAELRVGLFAEPRAYQAWIRFSNGSGTPRPDAKGDGRGMAVKLMGVAGARSTTQDFIMINSPTFFVKDAVDYVDFQRAGDNLVAFFLPGWNPLRLRWRELWNALSITLRKVSNPLNIRYWSVAPYLFGEVACKYSARPAGPPSAFVDTATPNFLADNLRRQLEAGDAAFDFMIQLRTRPGAMPIEDARIAWSETDAPFTPVARIEIPRQAVTPPDQDEFGEALSFTPWHGLDAHRPLGGISRARRTVYEAVSRLRHELNGEARQEPHVG